MAKKAAPKAPAMMHDMGGGQMMPGKSHDEYMAKMMANKPAKKSAKKR